MRHAVRSLPCGLCVRAAEFWLCNAIANPLKLAEFFSETKRHGFKSKVVKPPLGFDPIAIVLFDKPEAEKVETEPEPEAEQQGGGGAASASS